MPRMSLFGQPPAVVFTAGVLLVLVAAVASAQRVDSFVLPGYLGLPVDGGGSWFVTHYDAEGDGDLDLYVGRSHEFDQRYLNDGRGHFTRIPDTASWQIPGGSHDGVWIDLDGDGLDDLVLARSPASGSSATLAGNEQILLHRPDGSFVDASGNLPQGPPIGIFGNRNRLNFSMGIASGDFNRDGRADLVVANGGMNYLIHVLPLKPLDGQWALLPTLRNEILKDNLYLRVDADGNNDGIDDFVDRSAESGIGLVSDMSTDVAVADFNRDGYDDIFITNFYDVRLAIFHSGTEHYLSRLYLNHPDEPGKFTWARDSFPDVLRPSTSVSAADFDEDGDIDLFITNEARAAGSAAGERSRLYLNTGYGRFVDATDELLPESRPEYQSTYAGRFVDIDGDGRLDLVGAGIHSYIFLQGEDHRFIDATEGLPLHRGSGLPHTFHSYGMTVADFDGDARADILLADTYEQNRLHLQVGPMRFVDSTTINLPPDGENTIDAVIADLNSDTFPDIIALNYQEPHGHSLHLNTKRRRGGYPIFEDASDAVPSSPKFGRGVAVGDVNRDGRPDLLFCGYDGGMLMYNAGNDDEGRPIFVDSTGRWLPEFSAVTEANRGMFLDLNRDGHLDILLPMGKTEETGKPNALYLWSTGEGRFVDRSDLFPSNRSRTMMFDTADLNNDNLIDLLEVNEDGPPALYLSGDNGTPDNPRYRRRIPSAFFDNQSAAASLVDIDRDGDIDVVEVSACCPDGSGGPKHLYLNRGSATDGVPDFDAVVFGEPDYQNRAVATFDIDGDSYSDVVTAGRARALIYRYDPETERLMDVTDTYWWINNVSGLAMSAHAVALGDANLDGLTDVYLVRDNQDLLFYGVGEPKSDVKNAVAVQQPRIEVRPNPFREYLTVQLPEWSGRRVRLSLFDRLGREVLSVRQQPDADGTLRLRPVDEGADPAGGFYLLRIVDRGKRFVVPVVRGD